MRIRKVLIQNYRSIKHSGEITLDGSITTLIGRKENGKTNFLKAIESFDAGLKYERNDLCTYSKLTKELTAGSKQPEEIPIVTIWFDLDEEDSHKLDEIHSKLAKLEQLKVTKYYNNSYKVESEKIDISDLEPEGNVEINKMNSRSQLESKVESIKGLLEPHTKRLPEFENSRTSYEGHVNEFLLEISNKDTIDEIVTSVNILIDNLKKLPSQDAAIQNDIGKIESELKSLIKSLESELSETKEKLNDIEGQVMATLPSFIYFTDVDIIEDTVTVSEFQLNKERHKTLNNLFALANLDVDKLAKESPYERRSATEIASTVITGLVNNFWTQEKVKVSVGIDGGNLIIFISDEVGALDPPSRRSKGFQWFLSFYTKFTVGSKSEFRNTILLLDDPGVYLHPLGQEDLKKTLEELSTSNQILFATHSPFMVYIDNLERIRIVNKKSDGVGTEILEKYWVSDFDALTPLRAALGVKLGDVPFSSTKNLIVEGQEDLLYLEAMVSYFKRTNRKPVIDLSRVLILPANGADKVPFYATFLMREGRKVLVVLDYDTKGRNVKKTLIDNLIITEDKVVTLEQVKVDYNAGEEVEAEDLFDSDFYKHVVSETYSTQVAGGRVDLNKLDMSINKQTKRYNNLFKEAKISFNKLAVAQQVRLVVDDPSCTESIIGNSTIENFGKIFEIINKVLK